MKLIYDEETDSLYIEWNERPGDDSREISDNVVVDYDDAGKIVGIEIMDASKKIDLSALKLECWPGKVEQIKAPELVEHEH